jgi:hypothetical protein
MNTNVANPSAPGEIARVRADPTIPADAQGRGDRMPRARPRFDRGGALNRRALLREEQLDLLGNVDEALAVIRSIIDAAPDVGPVLVAAYRCLSTLGEMRETIDAMPVVKTDGG